MHNGSEALFFLVGLLNGDFTRTVAAMMLVVVDDAELAWGDAMNRRIGVNHITTFAQTLQFGRQVFGRVANLQRDIRWGQLSVDAVEVHNRKVLLIGCRRVVAVRHIDDVLFDVFLDDEPRTTTQSHTLALTDGVEPVAFVLSYFLASLQFYHVARKFA